jgi:p-cumate 2,3-dioxygenase alpha subunit
VGEWLRGAKDYLDLVCDQPENGFEVLPGSHKYAIRANWKMLVENFVDNYHFVILHQRQIEHMRTLGVKVGPPGAQSDVSRGKSLGNGHGVSEHQQLASFGRLAGHWGGLLPEWTKEPLAQLRARLIERHGEERTFRMTRTNRNVRIFPTLMVLDHISPVVRIMTPVAVDYTEVQEWILAPKGESAELRALRLSNNCLQVGPGGFVSPDDEEVLGLTQRGLANPEMEWVDSSRGMAIRRCVSSDEQQMRGLHRHWHEMMSLRRVRHPDDV